MVHLMPTTLCPAPFLLCSRDSAASDDAGASLASLCHPLLFFGCINVDSYLDKIFFLFYFSYFFLLLLLRRSFLYSIPSTTCSFPVVAVHQIPSLQTDESPGICSSYVLLLFLLLFRMNKLHTPAANTKIISSFQNHFAKHFKATPLP